MRQHISMKCVHDHWVSVKMMAMLGGRTVHKCVFLFNRIYSKMKKKKWKKEKISFVEANDHHLWRSFVVGIPSHSYTHTHTMRFTHKYSLTMYGPFHHWDWASFWTISFFSPPFLLRFLHSFHSFQMQTHILEFWTVSLGNSLKL